MMITKIRIMAHRDDWSALARTELMRIDGIIQVDINEEKKVARIHSVRGLSASEINTKLWEYEIAADVYEQSAVSADAFVSPAAAPDTRARVSEGHKVMKLRIEGMTCRSCELTIEKKFKHIAGVVKVNVNAGKGIAYVTHSARVAPEVSVLQSAIAPDGYRVRSMERSRAPSLDSAHGSAASPRLSFFGLAGLFAAALFALFVLSKAGIFKTGLSIGQNTSMLTVFFIGLVAASSSCIAVSGGLLLSSAARFNERYGGTGVGRMYPVYLFVFGRILSYAALGGLIGLLGKSFAFPPVVTGFITLIAALYMLVMGLEMLHIAPQWLKRILPNLSSKSLSHKVLDAGDTAHPLMPFVLGAATFFLPCGFTQALQLYALTTGSVLTSASMLLMFALGTAPALIALGWASSSLKGKAGAWFFRFSGALVVILGLWNIQNGLSIIGYPLPVDFAVASAANRNPASSAYDPHVVFDGTKQIVKMAVDGGYLPDEFTVKAGIPVRWEIDATNGGGCLSVLQSRELGIQKFLGSNPDNVIEFTPETPGRYLFSCSMGMYRGYVNVVSNS